MSGDEKMNVAVVEIVVIGASAGGIDALTTVLSSIPADFPVPIVIVQHLKELEEETKLHLILARRSGFPVILARDQADLLPGKAYLAEPGKHLKVNKEKLFHDNGKPVRFVRPSVDVLFTSAAQVFGPGVLGVVLSGIGSDGAAGCRDIKKAGGRCIAQEKCSSMFYDMPEAAIKTGAIDYVLGVEVIGTKIVELVMTDNNRQFLKGG